MSLLPKFTIMLVFGMILQLILAWPLMILWNDALVPAISGVHEIGWLQAWFLQVVAALLFRSEIKFKD